MKRLEDIEYMDVEQLEAAALQEHIPIPEGLEDRIKASIAAATVAEGAAKQKPVRWIPYAAVAAAAAIAAVAIIPSRSNAGLKDTFDDPYLAYAQVEAVFQNISDKMSVGVGMTENAAAVAGKPVQIINKINQK